MGAHPLAVRALLLAAAAVFVASAVSADDAIFDASTMPGVVEDTNPFVYFQLLGGVTAGGEITQVNPATTIYDLSPGRALAGTIGVVVAEGLSLEADVLRTQRDYTDFPGDTFSTTSLMANVKYTAALNDTLSLYGAVGVGAIWGVDYFANYDDDYHVSGLGFQLIAGASAYLMENLAAIGEIRYQGSFGPLHDEPRDDLRDTAVVAVTTGLKLSF